MLHLRNAFFTLGAATLAACSSGYGGGPMSPPSSDPRTVSASSSLTFTPSAITLNVGDTVTFAFGPVAHNVFFEAQAGAPADIGGNNANVSFKRVLTTAGTYRYTCHIHPSMQGTVTVR